MTSGDASSKVKIEPDDPEDVDVIPEKGQFGYTKAEREREEEEKTKVVTEKITEKLKGEMMQEMGQMMANMIQGILPYQAVPVPLVPAASAMMSSIQVASVQNTLHTGLSVHERLGRKVEERRSSDSNNGPDVNSEMDYLPK